MFNVAIIGAESFNDYNYCQDKCIKCLKKKAESGESITIFSTGDSFVEQFSKRFHINVRYFYTDWKKYGKMALKQRNNELMESCNAMIIFDNNTKDVDMIKKLATSNNVPFRNFVKR